MNANEKMNYLNSLMNEAYFEEDQQREGSNHLQVECCSAAILRYNQYCNYYKKWGTADIMTGWHLSVKTLLKNTNKKPEEYYLPSLDENWYVKNPESSYKIAEEIKKKILDDGDFTDNFKAFWKVRYTLGNMIPVNRPQKVGPSFDMWCYKMWRFAYKSNHILDDSVFKDYVHNAYLQDYVRGIPNGNPKIVSQIDGSLQGEDGVFESPKSLGSLDSYYRITTKLIIQRGYRIDKRFTGKWNEARAKEVSEAFEAVGLPPDPAAEHGLPYTVIGEWEE